jgi:hypothetical protein
VKYQLYLDYIWRATSSILNALTLDGVEKFVKWPDASSLDTIATSFENRNDEGLAISNVIGSKDGCHIPIEAPKEDQWSYVNRKNRHSLNLLALCLPNKLFTYIDAGFPGSAHDSRVLKTSAIWVEIHTNIRNVFPGKKYHVIGDSAFPCLPWLILSLKTSLATTPQLRAFNKQLSRQRIIIENTFGDLKCRFRRLHFLKMRSIHRAVKIFMGSCILHNFCILHDDVHLGSSDPEMNIGNDSRK